MHDPGLFILKGKEPVPEPDPAAWARWMCKGAGFNEERRVGETTWVTGKSLTRVLTTFTGFGPPCFQTLVLGGPLAGHTADHGTWDEALAGHEAVVALCRAALLKK